MCFMLSRFSSLMWYSFRYSYLRIRLYCILPSSFDCHVTVRYYSIMKSNPQALLLSSSNCHGYSLLEFAKQEICWLLEKHNVSELVFVPYAQKNYDDYTKKIKDAITPWGFSVVGLHTYPDPVNAIHSAKAIFVGGGNTFLLLKTLYDNKLVDVIRERVNTGNLVYIGSSAGTNVATKSIHTTNDMPIIYPPSFDAISIVPFNINPHYIDKVETDTHKGETRDQRIEEFMEMPHANPVLGLREGCILHVDGDSLKLKGVTGAVLFKVDQRIEEFMEMPHANPVLGLREGCILHVDGDSLKLKGVTGAVLFKVGEKKVEYPVGADVSFLLDCYKDTD